MKRTKAELRALIPEEDVRECFMARPDIAYLPAIERKRRWATASKKIDAFLGQISKRDSFVIP